MAAISKITIDGFKAFPQEFELILDGKNLLMYGENGSGKSSIYYALHALLQSQCKDKCNIYFSTTHPESIVNKYTNKPDAKVEIKFEGSDVTYSISQTGYNESVPQATSPLRDLNGKCIFINHKFLFNVFSFRNSQYIDLFPVFIKDILPFTLTRDKSKYISELYDEAVAKIKRKGRGNRIDDTYKDLIKKFNKETEYLIKLINQNAVPTATDIFNNNFRDIGDRKLKISLEYNHNRDDIPQPNKSYWLRLGYRYHPVEIAGRMENKKLSTELEVLQPVITLKVEELQEENVTYISIEKPQTYFNEAKLTAIALSIRFALLNTVDPADGRFLALDDMLISLDMSNRMKVIDYIFKEVLPKYKLYIFTHDRLLFTSFKKRINADKLQEDWLCGGVYMHDRDNSIDFNLCNPYPIFIEEKDALLSAREYYIMHDYPACGQRLRKWCEDIFERLYPSALLKSIDGTTGKTIDTSLNDRIVRLNDYCINESIDFNEFKDLKIYKDNVLNLVSHYDVSSPIYGNEILSIMRILSKLSQIATDKKTVGVNRQLGIELKANDGRAITVCIDIRSNKLNIIEYNGASRVSYYTKCLVYKVIDAGVHTEITPEVSFDSIYNAYESYCEKYGADYNIALLDVLYDHGTLIKGKL